MKLIQVTTDTDRRGAQVFAHELGGQFQRRGHEVRTLALAGGGRGPSLPFDVLGSRRLAPSTLLGLRASLRDADAVIGYGSSTLPACAAATLGTDVPFVYRSIGDLSYWANTRAKRFRVRHFLQRTAHVVVLWPEAMATVVQDFGVDGERVSVIPRGVDSDHFRPVGWDMQAPLRSFLGLPSRGPVACLVGSLSPEKGIDVAFRAAELIPELHLVVAGSGELEHHLTKEAERILPGRVTFLGRVSDTRPVYGASDLLLLASHSEGVPGVVIEAGLSGRPAVATDVGGTGYIIADGSTGRLVPACTPHAMASAISQVLEAAAPLGAEARRDYRLRFSLAAVANRWEEALERVTT